MDVPTARTRQQEISATIPVLEKEIFWGPLVELPDPEPWFAALERDSVLEVQALAGLRGWANAWDSWCQVPREEIRSEKFKQIVLSLPDASRPLKILESVLGPDGELSDRASPKLGALRAEIRALRQEIQNTIDRLVKQYAQKGIIQDAFSDVRDGRYVIPVKISQQSEIEGNIYEASVSRQTVFMEPAEVTPLNNRLRARQNDLLAEIYRILEETSRKLKPYLPDFRAAAAILIHWDTAQARARFGQKFGGKPIDVVEGRVIKLRATAHPLLWFSIEPTKIIRNSLDLAEPTTALLLTGPNTGGKTVLLKTLGLAAICARAGFPFPASEPPTIPFFEAIFADLGDPQSIEKHLSSFSGHVLHYKEILETLTPRSLVLIDELNTATDPEEGAALGRAFLETIIDRGAMVVTTTHDPHLKAAAMGDRRVLSGGMEFDEKSRMPTYRVAFGVPGRSRALETAERLGMPAPVLELARKYISRQHDEFERTIARLESEVASAESLRKEAQATREEAEKLRREWTEKTQLAVGDVLDKARQRLRRVVEQVQDEVRAKMRDLDSSRARRDNERTRADIQAELAGSVRKLGQAMAEEAPELAALIPEESMGPIAARSTSEPASAAEPDSEGAAKPAAIGGKPSSDVEVGMDVRVPRWKSLGKVIGVQGANKIKVAIGTMQVQLKRNEIELLNEAELKKLRASAPPVAPGAKKRANPDADRPPVPPSEIDLRGKRYDDAMSEVERYLDHAYRSGGRLEVTIIHGLGTGAIREGVRSLLESLPYIKEFGDAGAGRGGSGATRVEFDLG